MKASKLLTIDKLCAHVTADLIHRHHRSLTTVLDRGCRTYAFSYRSSSAIHTERSDRRCAVIH